MKITKAEISIISLPMHTPFETGFGKISHKDEIIVALFTEDGMVGYGESATLSHPVYNHETTESCWLALKNSILPQVVGKDFDTVESFVASYANIVGNTAARAGAECAFWHLLAQKQNTSLKALFGGVQSNIMVGEGVGITNSTEELLGTVESYLQDGFRRIKVKIKPGWDHEPLAAIREHWPDIKLMADGNSQYSLADHAQTLISLEKYDLEMIEQPLASTDFVDHATLQSQTATPVCLDESIENLNDARTAIALGSCKVINIKIGRVGGVLEAMHIHDYAKEHGVTVWSGGMLETGVGRAFSLALASKPAFVHAADLSPYQMYFTDDITAPGLQLQKDGYIAVPDSPGLGFDIDAAKMKQYTTRHHCIEP